MSCRCWRSSSPAPGASPRLRHRRRPGAAVRRADRVAQGHRLDHLLLPAERLPPGGVPRRARQGRPGRRARHGRGAEPGLPRRDALGRGPVLEKHYVPRRSQRARSVLTFSPKTPAPVPCSTPTRACPRPARAARSSRPPTTGKPHRARPGPADLRLQAHHPGRPRRARRPRDGFITLRARHPGITTGLVALPASAWKPMTLGRPREHPPGHGPRRPRRQLSAYAAIRQLAVTGLGHDQPTLLITNRPLPPPGHRDLRPADEHRAAPRRSHPVLQPRRPRRHRPAQHRPRRRALRLAHTLCAALRRRLPATARPPRHPPAPVSVHRRDHHHRSDQITIRRTGAPTHPSSARPASQTITVPWWEGRPSAPSTPDPPRADSLSEIGANAYSPTRVTSSGPLRSACKADKSLEPDHQAEQPPGQLLVIS